MRHVECCYRLWQGFSPLRRQIHLFDNVGETKATQKEKKNSFHKEQNATLSRSSPGSAAGSASTLCSSDCQNGHQEKENVGQCHEDWDEQWLTGRPVPALSLPQEWPLDLFFGRLKNLWRKIGRVNQEQKFNRRGLIYTTGLDVQFLFVAEIHFF